MLNIEFIVMVLICYNLMLESLKTFSWTRITVHWLKRNHSNKNEKERTWNSEIMLLVKRKHENANLMNTLTAPPSLHEVFSKFTVSQNSFSFKWLVVSELYSYNPAMENCFSISRADKDKHNYDFIVLLYFILFYWFCFLLQYGIRGYKNIFSSKYNKYP